MERGQMKSQGEQRKGKVGCRTQNCQGPLHPAVQADLSPLGYT